jgi:hypothetical protein
MSLSCGAVLGGTGAKLIITKNKIQIKRGASAKTIITRMKIQIKGGTDT